MMKKTSASLAVLLLIGDVSARQRAVTHVMPGAYNYISFEDEDEDAVAQTTQSIAESESSHNSKFVPKEDLYKQSLQQNNKLSFKDDEFQTMNNLDNSMTQHHFIGLSADNMFIPQAAM